MIVKKRKEKKTLADIEVEYQTVNLSRVRKLKSKGHVIPVTVQVILEVFC